MSAELCTSPGPREDTRSTTAGGTKPLHRFLKGQPKIVGIIVLVLGTSIFTVTTGVKDAHVWTGIPHGFIQGPLYIICGILYIFTEHNPTKKTVTISLAFSIVTLLGTLWTTLGIISNFAHVYYAKHYNDWEDWNVTDAENFASLQLENMTKSLEAIFLVTFLMGGVIFIVMSILGGIALRSTNSQAIVVMTTARTEAPVT